MPQFDLTTTEGLNQAIQFVNDQTQPETITNTLIADIFKALKGRDIDLTKLSNVDNTSDLDKPISTATQQALNNKQNKVTVIPITGNITLSETHNGAILHVTNTCNITIPTGLDANFQCVVYAKGSIIVTFVNGGVALNSPSGLLLKTDKMASLFANASNTFNLLGELATS